MPREWLLTIFSWSPGCLFNMKKLFSLKPSCFLYFGKNCLCWGLHLFLISFLVELSVSEFQSFRSLTCVKVILYRMKAGSPASIICVWDSSFPSTISQRGHLLFSACFGHFCQRPLDCRHMSWLLWAEFDSIGPCVYFCQCHALLAIVTVGPQSLILKCLHLCWAT